MDQQGFTGGEITPPPFDWSLSLLNNIFENRVAVCQLLSIQNEQIHWGLKFSFVIKTPCTPLKTILKSVFVDFEKRIWQSRQVHPEIPIAWFPGLLLLVCFDMFEMEEKAAQSCSMWTGVWMAILH
jgi:hypothetical protein